VFTLISQQEGIQCKTVEQLALILTRVGSASLKLKVFWPVAEGTLELISTRKYPIRSLKIIHEAKAPFNISGFKDFNYSEIQELNFWILPWDQCRQIMDLSLQSKCKNMTFETVYDPSNLDFFKHELLQQVADITLWAC
jgi:hypothetical protein